QITIRRHFRTSCDTLTIMLGNQTQCRTISMRRGSLSRYQTPDNMHKTPILILSIPIHISQIDAFTNKPFAGNPAGVCILPKAAGAGWMLYVAREMNLAETAFLVKQRDGYDVRWFTPAIEVDLCGHATLASAHVLWEDGHLPN